MGGGWEPEAPCAGLPLGSVACMVGLQRCSSLGETHPLTHTTGHLPARHAGTSPPSTPPMPRTEHPARFPSLTFAQRGLESPRPSGGTKGASGGPGCCLSPIPALFWGGCLAGCLLSCCGMDWAGDGVPMSPSLALPLLLPKWLGCLTGPRPPLSSTGSVPADCQWASPVLDVLQASPRTWPAPS